MQRRARAHPFRNINPATAALPCACTGVGSPYQPAGADGSSCTAPTAKYASWCYASASCPDAVASKGGAGGTAFWSHAACGAVYGEGTAGSDDEVDEKSEKVDGEDEYAGIIMPTPYRSQAGGARCAEEAGAWVEIAVTTSSESLSTQRERFSDVWVGVSAPTSPAIAVGSKAAGGAGTCKLSGGGGGAVPFLGCDRASIGSPWVDFSPASSEWVVCGMCM